MTLKNALVSAAGNAAADNLYVEDVFSTYLYTGNGGSSGAAIQFIPTGINLNTSGAKVFNITNGTSWVVPDDWDSSNNKIEVIGAGGCAGYGSGSVGSGGGGGAYSSITNLSLTPGATITLQVGKNQGYIGGGTGNKGTDTWFNGTSLASASVSAEAGYGGASTGAGGIGGRASVGVGSTKYSGGAGASKTLGGGGGGAAGPNGNGVSSTGNNGGDGDNGVGGTGGTSSSATGGTGTQFPLSSGVVRGVGGGGWGGTSGNGGYGGFAGGGGGSTDGDYYNVGQAGDGIIIITYYSTEPAGGDGLVWVKRRDGTAGHDLTDTVTGVGKVLATNSASAQYSYINTPYVTPDGFAVSQSNNNLNYTYGSWTFKQQSKFFDIVTYTGDGISGRVFTHDFGSTVGMVIIKNTSNTANWNVWHRNAPNNLCLNTTAAESSTDATWTGAVRSVTDTTFTLYAGGGGITSVNQNGHTYVAYLFAHDAGGFGDDGTENVISCGSYTGTGAAGNAVTLGYEPQWLLIKNTSSVTSWQLYDTMRGMPLTGSTARLTTNLSSSEFALTPPAAFPTATGFELNSSNGDVNASGDNYIYIAIRRGPMKTPTSGTEVFSPLLNSGATGSKQTTGFVVDGQIVGLRAGLATNQSVQTRLTGVNTTSTLSSRPYLSTSDTAAETGATNRTRYWDNTGYELPDYWGTSSTIYWNFRRAPGFFDVVCYTGTGNTGPIIDGYYTQTLGHNLAAVPELVIIKNRLNFSSLTYWVVSPPIGTGYLKLNATDSYQSFAGFFSNKSYWTDSTWNVQGAGTTNNASGDSYIAYLFATLPGVSKVGSYTGTGTTNQIDCGFSSGARFVLIKRTDSTGDWYVYDSARGIVAANDPYLLLNSSAAEVTSTDYVDTYSAGFELTSTAPAGLNASGGSYIFLAIA